MAGGVTLRSIHVDGCQGDDHLIIVTLCVKAEDEFEAVQWLLSQLEDR